MTVSSVPELCTLLRIGALSGDQQALVESVVKTILAPYRQEDVDESMTILKSNGGLDELRMAFCQQLNPGDDRVWDVWLIEGPSFDVHFRGAPHVHAYIHISVRAQTTTLRQFRHGAE